MWLRVVPSCFLLRAEILGDLFRPKASMFAGEYFGIPWKVTFLFLESAVLVGLNGVSLELPASKGCGSVEFDSFD